MTNHDELLARLDAWAVEMATPFPQNEVMELAAAAIRELTENKTHYLAAKRTAEENELKCAQELDEVRAQLFFAQTALAAERKDNTATHQLLDMASDKWVAEKQARAEAEYRLIRCAGQSAQHWYHKYEAAEQRLAKIEAEIIERCAKVCDARKGKETRAYDKVSRVDSMRIADDEASSCAVEIRALRTAAPQDQAAPKGQAKEIEETGSHAPGPADAAVTVQKCHICGEPEDGPGKTFCSRPHPFHAVTVQVPRESWKPYLHNYADGVDGHYCIARHNPSGYEEFYNKGKWCSAGEVFILPDHRKAVIKAAAPIATPTSQDEVKK